MSLIVLAGFLLVFAPVCPGGGDPAPAEGKEPFPRALDSYDDHEMTNIFTIIKHRAASEPFNFAATLIFFLAVVHTFLTSRFQALSHNWEEFHRKKIAAGKAAKYSVSHRAELFHFLGEVEAVFGIWAAATVAAIVGFYDWETTVLYISRGISFTEPIFVVVIMILAATRPILKLAEKAISKIAGLLGGSLTAWWFSILTIGPLLGSFITEPAAMTISALLLSSKFYQLSPSGKFKYATIGLLFVNVSVGGTLSHFAAPPVLMVAGPWNWGMGYMFSHFGWKASIGILLANGLYLLAFRTECRQLQKQFSLVRIKDELQRKYLRQKDVEAELDKMGCMLGDRLGFRQEFEQRISQMKKDMEKVFIAPHKDRFLSAGIDLGLVHEAYEQRFEEILRRRMRKTIPGLLPEEQRPVIMDPEWDDRDDAVPVWVIVAHVLFMVWTIFNAHHPALFVPGLLFFLGFAQVTSQYQNRIDLKPPMLVGFFLGGLVIHGGLQGWWISPVLGNLGEMALMGSAMVLTAFNDNAAITFLSTLVPDFTEGLKYSVLAGAVAGGGLTVIANAPNPAGQSILKKHFENGISPVNLLLGAAVPTVIMLGCFLLFR